MIYLLNMILSVGYFYFIRNVRKNSFILFIPIIFLWTIISGGQYGVGSDYFSYIKIYENHQGLNRFYYNKEYLFYYFVIFFSNLIKNGQFLFFFDALLKNILFFFIIKKIIKDMKYIYIYIYIYICFGTVFYNQMNGLRNFLAMYLFTLGQIYLIEYKYILFVLYITIGSYIHRTSLYLYPFILINKLKHYRFLFLLIGVVVLLNFLPTKNFFQEVGPKLIPAYAHYFYSEYYERDMKLINIFSRIIWFPFYIESIYLYKKNKNDLIKLGVIGYSINLLTIEISILSRLAVYFSLVSIFPMYYLTIYYLKNKRNKSLIILILLILLFFITKVLIVPKGEYLYRSWFFI